MAVGLLVSVFGAAQATGATFDDFSTDPDLAGSWSVSANYLGANWQLDCDIDSGHIAWDPVEEDLNVSSMDDEALATLYRNGAARADTDPVTMTISDYAYSGQYWTGLGVVLAESYDWQLLSGEDSCYRWGLSTNGAVSPDCWYELKVAGNEEILHYDLPEGPPESVVLDIVRDGDDYVFLANGVEMARDNRYGSTSFPCYGIIYATSVYDNVLSANVDDFGIGTGPDLEGDLNGDGFVGGDDLDIVRSFWGQNVTAGDLLSGDPSGDGFVGGDDLDIVRASWGQGTPPAPQSVPEPTGWILLGTFLVSLEGFRRLFAH